jgi:hypothetical protein
METLYFFLLSFPIPALSPLFLLLPGRQGHISAGPTDTQCQEAGWRWGEEAEGVGGRHVAVERQEMGTTEVSPMIGHRSARCSHWLVLGFQTEHLWPLKTEWMSVRLIWPHGILSSFLPFTHSHFYFLIIKVIPAHRKRKTMKERWPPILQNNHSRSLVYSSYGFQRFRNLQMFIYISHPDGFYSSI